MHVLITTLSLLTGRPRGPSPPQSDNPRGMAVVEVLLRVALDGGGDQDGAQGAAASATKAAATTPPPAPPAPAPVPFVHTEVLTTAPPLPTGMPFVRVHGVLSDGRRLDCVVSDAPTAAGAFDGTILVGSEADAATGAAAEAAAAAVDANATDASAPAEACAVLSTDGSAHVHVGCEVEGGRWWIKARLEDGAWLLSRGEGYKVQNAVAGGRSLI